MSNDVYALQDYPLHNLSEYAGWALNSETTQSASKDSPCSAITESKDSGNFV
jgi:molybdopterin biosynthesis enzyme